MKTVLREDVRVLSYTASFDKMTISALLKTVECTPSVMHLLKRFVIRFPREDHEIRSTEALISSSPGDGVLISHGVRKTTASEKGCQKIFLVTIIGVFYGISAFSMCL